MSEIARTGRRERKKRRAHGTREPFTFFRDRYTASGDGAAGGFDLGLGRIYVYDWCGSALSLAPPARRPSVCCPSEARRPSVGESSVISPWRVRFPSVCSPPPRRRPSWNVAKCRHQTNARPSAAGQKSVAGPWRVRRARTPHEPTQDERHTGRDRTLNEQPTNTDAPARQASRESTRPVASPCEVRHKPVACPWEGRSVSVDSPFHVRGKSV